VFEVMDSKPARYETYECNCTSLHQTPPSSTLCYYHHGQNEIPPDGSLPRENEENHEIPARISSNMAKISTSI
jgi:hypothetical protein